MTQARFKIVFDGQLMPDVTLETAKSNLARLFKSDTARIEALFKGGTVAIKRNLAEDEADKYLAALQGAGANARKEAEQSQTTGFSLVAHDDDHSTATVTTSTASAEMSCPKCGAQQPKAVECTACGIVIEKYLARQALLKDSQAETATTTPLAIDSSPYATPQAPVGESLEEYGELNVFSIEGRIGRLRYLAWSLVLMLACIPVFAVAAIGFGMSDILGAILVGVAAIGMLVVAVQIGVQRLHDLNWSGWLFLLTLIPIVGSVMNLLMLVVPGTTGANGFGPPPPPNSTAVKVLCWLWLLVPVLGIVAAIALPAYQEYVNRAGL